MSIVYIVHCDLFTQWQRKKKKQNKYKPTNNNGADSTITVLNFRNAKFSLSRLAYWLRWSRDRSPPEDFFGKFSVLVEEATVKKPIIIDLPLIEFSRVIAVCSWALRLIRKYLITNLGQTSATWQACQPEPLWASIGLLYVVRQWAHYGARGHRHPVPPLATHRATCQSFVNMSIFGSGCAREKIPTFVYLIAGALHDLSWLLNHELHDARSMTPSRSREGITRWCPSSLENPFWCWMARALLLAVTYTARKCSRHSDKLLVVLDLSVCLKSDVSVLPGTVSSKMRLPFFN